MGRTCRSWAVVTVLSGAAAGFAGQDPGRSGVGNPPAAPPPAAVEPLPGGDWFTDEAAARRQVREALDRHPDVPAVRQGIPDIVRPPSRMDPSGTAWRMHLSA